MPWLTRYGTYIGQVPATFGRVHFVAPAASYTVDGKSYAASDDNDGLSPERALRTISQAITNATASAGEVILLLEGTHSPSATVRINKAGLTIAGVRSPFGRDHVTGAAFAGIGFKSKVSFGTAAAPGFSVEADNTEICFLELQPASGFGAVIFRNSNPDGLYMHDFVINMAAGQAISLDTAGIDFGYRADTAGLATRSMTRLTQTSTKATAYLSNFSIVSGGAQGPGLLTATADVTVVGARFHNRAGAWASPFVVATGTGYVFVQGSHWSGPHVTSLGVCIDGTAAGTINHKVTVRDCRFPVLNPGTNSPVDNFTAGVVGISESYRDNNNLSAVTGLVGLSTPYQVISSD